MTNLYRVTYVNAGVSGSMDVCMETPQEAAAYAATELATPISEGTALILGASELATDVDMDSVYWVAPE